MENLRTFKANNEITATAKRFVVRATQYGINFLEHLIEDTNGKQYVVIYADGEFKGAKMIKSINNLIEVTRAVSSNFSVVEM